MSWLDNEGPTTIISESAQALSWGPTVEGRTPSAKVTLPRVAAYEFREARVHAHGSALALPDRLVLERLPDIGTGRADYRNPLVSRHWERLAVVVNGPRAPIERGVFLGGNGAFNYYHWLVELLPKLQALQLLDGFTSWPLLIPSSVAKSTNLMRAFQWAARGRPFRVLHDEMVYEIGQLLYVNSASLCTFNLRPGHGVVVSDFRLARSTVDFWRSLRSEVPAVEGPKRIFFARRPGRRDYNQEAVATYLVKRGFTPVYSEDLSLAEQVAISAGAEAFAGPSGAAWTNLLFATPGAVAVSWLPEPYREAAAYSNLAREVGVIMEFVLHPTSALTTGELYLAGYRLDIDRLGEALDRVLEAR